MKQALSRKQAEPSSHSAATPLRLADRGQLDNGSIMHLQRTVGNRAVMRLIRPQQAAAADKPAIQRTISVGKEQLVFKDDTEALNALKSTFSHIDPGVLEIILSAFDADPEYNKFYNLASLKQEVEKAAQWMTSKDAYDADPKQWGVLHRLKGKLKPQIADLPRTREEGSFKRLVKALDADADTDKKRLEYEGTDSKYDPTKFSRDGSNKHTWESNESWLKVAMGKFSKMLLTDIPLTAENVKRQTDKKYGFSAYAREIAALLQDNYLPVGRKTFQSRSVSLDTVSLVRRDQLPRSLMVVINQKIKINKTVAQKIYNDDGLSTQKALEFFDEAGLPTDKTPSKALKMERFDKKKEEQEKLEASVKEVTDVDRIQFLAELIGPQATEIPFGKEYWKGVQESKEGKFYFADWGFKRINAFANVNAGKILTSKK